MLSSTILASLIIFATIAYSVYSFFQNDETTRFIVIVAVVILSLLWLFAALQTPHSVEVSTEQVRIKLLLNSIRIHRDENGMSEIRGLYPCGEGAGYAGGITSAAMDGLKMAEALIKNNQETN